MNRHSLFFILLTVLTPSCLFAATIPGAVRVHHDIRDTATEPLNVSSFTISKAQKKEFLQGLKTKVLSFLLKKQLSHKANSNTKSVLAWIALALVVGGIGLGVIFGSGAAFAMILLGVLTGIVSLAIKGKDEQSAADKKGRKVALWSVIVGGVLVALVIIALASWGGH